MFRRSARLAAKPKVEKEAEDEDSEEEEEEEEVEDDDSSYEDETDKKARQREKARERREKLEANKAAGRAVDPSTRTFGLGSASRAVSRTGRSLLEAVHSREHDDIATTTASFEGATDSLKLPPAIPPFVAFAALRQASSISPDVRDIETSFGTLNRGSDRQRRQSQLPGPKRLNYPQVRGLGTYGVISADPTDRPSERLLESEESARDPSSGDAAFAKSLLRKRGKLKKRREKGPESDLAVQELVGANSLHPDIERLKTQNVGNTINLLEDSDVPLATSSSGTPVFGRDYHQSLSSLIARPGSPSREDEALRRSFRIAREAEDLSGLRSPTPDEIQGHRGYSSTLPTTWTAPPSPLATAPASSSTAGPRKKKRKTKKRRRRRSDSDASSSDG